MKTFNLKTRHAALAVAAILCVVLISWDFKQNPFFDTDKQGKDTIPGRTQKKIVNLDDAIAELDALDFEQHVEKALADAQKSLSEIDFSDIKRQLEESLRDLNMDKIRMETEKELMAVDFEKMKKEMAEAMVEMKDAEKEIAAIDFGKIQSEIKTAIESVNWEEINQELKKVKEVDLAKAQQEIEAANEKIRKVIPEMENAKVEIEKAKKELRLYKELLDGLENDGVLDQGKDFEVEHKNGKLTVNGKQVPDAVYNKYKHIFDQTKDVRIRKHGEGLNINKD